MKISKSWWRGAASAASFSAAVTIAMAVSAVNPADSDAPDASTGATKEVHTSASTKKSTPQKVETTKSTPTKSTPKKKSTPTKVVSKRSTSPRVETPAKVAITSGKVRNNSTAGAPLQKADYGEVKRMTLFSPQLKRVVDIDIWLPPHFADGKARRVIYMHDGQNLYDASTTWNHQSWEVDSVFSAMVADGRLKEVDLPMVVGVHSVAATRIGDLMPQNALAYDAELVKEANGRFAKSKVHGNDYASFIVNTVRPEVSKIYGDKIATDSEHTFVMGSSMGGLMSIYMMSEYPEVFSAAGCLSTHWIGTTDGNPAFPTAMRSYLTDHLPDNSKAEPGKTHRLYLDHGTTTLDSLYGPWEERMIELVKNKGYSEPQTLKTLIAPGAAHEEKSWAARLATPMLFLLKPNK